MGLVLEFKAAGAPGGELLEYRVDSVGEALDLVSRREVATTACLVRDGRTVARLKPCGEMEARFWRVERG